MMDLKNNEKISVINYQYYFWMIFFDKLTLWNSLLCLINLILVFQLILYIEVEWFVSPLMYNPVYGWEK